MFTLELIQQNLFSTPKHIRIDMNALCPPPPPPMQPANMALRGKVARLKVVILCERHRRMVDGNRESWLSKA